MTGSKYRQIQVEGVEAGRPPIHPTLAVCLHSQNCPPLDDGYPIYMKGRRPILSLPLCPLVRVVPLATIIVSVVGCFWREENDFPALMTLMNLMNRSAHFGLSHLPPTSSQTTDVACSIEVGDVWLASKLALSLMKDS